MSRRSAVQDTSAAIGSALYGLATSAVRRLPRDMSITSAATLATLRRSGPRRITDLAAIEGVTQPAMTVLVRGLAEAGLVERSGDASDKRVTLVRLTEAGASYVERRRQAGVDAFARLIDGLAEDEVETLAAALPALTRLAELESQDREGPAPEVSGRPQEASMAKGYWVSVYRVVSDREKLAAYDELARRAVQAGGGRPLSVDGRVVAHEAGVAQRVVLVEFDSFDQAVATYESEAYQQALVVLSDSVERDFRIVEGIG
jgi:DNA-binding MarR family transcriptional regulator/uncharacterized protein (DUF1330 family)